MSKKVPPATLTPDRTPDLAADRAFNIKVLHRLMDTGTDIARLIALQAQNHPRPEEFAASFEQVSKAIRQTAELAMKLAAKAAEQPPAPKPPVRTITFSHPPAAEDVERQRKLSRLN